MGSCENFLDKPRFELINQQISVLGSAGQVCRVCDAQTET